MKQLWNVTSSDADLKPIMNVTSTLNQTTRVTRVQTDIKGLLNNQKMSEEPKLAASAAWMSYPVSLFDATKVNFTIEWSNMMCPESVRTPINCSPQGGFALVFQQESQTALGEYRNNLGEGLGYDGISGVLAFEFDTFASLHNDQSIVNNLQVSVQVRNKNTKLLSTRPSSSLSWNSQPINFGSFNRSDFRPQTQISIGLIPNQLSQTIQIVVYINGIPQIKTKATFRQLGLDPNRMYYLGFTGSQNLDRKNAATGSLSVLNFRIFKTKPKFVDGQVSYLWDYIDQTGNFSLLEVRSSFYDLCMQKTTMVVYPTVSLQDWQNGTEEEPRILAFNYTRDTFVIGSKINPLRKADFYKPATLTLLPDVKFQMSIPTGRTQAIRMGFYWGLDLIMNITAIDYFRQQQSTNFDFIGIENSDIVTGTLAMKGYANNNYQFNIYCYDKSLNPSPIYFSQLQLTVSSDYIRLNDTVYSNVVPTTCYGVSAQNGNQDGGQVLDTNRNILFTCSFMPNVNGTYYINSPYLPSGRSFKVQIDEASQVTKVLSSEYSQAIITGDFLIDVGSMVEVYIDLRDYLNNTYKLQPEDGCTFTKSYYTQNDQKYSFLFYDGFPYLRTKFTRAGVAEFRITIACTRMEFDLQCFRCQKVIQPLPQYFYYKLSIPAYPSSFDVKLDSLTNIMLSEGSNLVVDIDFYDRYDNIIGVELNETFSSAVSVQLQYVTRGQRRNFNLNKTLIPGKVMLSLGDADNQFFKNLPPRANTYFLEITVPKQEACFALDKVVKNLYITSTDRMAPIESVGDGDVNKFDPLLSTVQWDRVLYPGKVGRISFTVRNQNMLQLSTWPSTFISDFLDARIIDSAGRDLRTLGICSVKFGFGLYEGEYFAWYQCRQTPLTSRYATLQILYTGQALLNQQLPFWILPANATASDKAFVQPPTQMVPLGNGRGLDILFRLYDGEGNQIDTVLLDRDQPHLGQITYNLTRVDTGVIARFGPLPMFNTSGFFRIHLDNMPIGRYRLDLNLPTRQLSTDVVFNSSSQRVSPVYSYAFRENGQITQMQVNSFVTVRFYARNIHNQSIERNADSSLLMQQTRVYLTSSNGYTVMMNFFGNLFDSATGQVYYNFTTVERLTRNGKYFVNIYFPDTNEWMFVQNGTFTIQDRFEPLSSELYLIKGLELKEFRMIPYNITGGLENAFNASHYDPRIDGSLRWKLYLRTNVNNEVVTQGDFSNVQVRNAYMASAQYSTKGTFEIRTELLISLTIQNVNNEHLIIRPTAWEDQDSINRLPEGYYFLYVQGTQFGIQFEMRWIFSLFNSELEPSALQSQMNFYAPRFVNVTAGEPFTFVVAAFGNKSPRLINVVVSKSDGLTIEIDKTSDNSPAGYIYYVTIYHEAAGIYRPELRADVLPARELVIQVNPAPFHQLRLIDPTQVASRKLAIGSQIAFNFTFVDRYNNSIFQFQKERPHIQKVSDMIQVVHQDSKPVIKFVRAVSSTLYQANFTTWYLGTLQLALPFQTASPQQQLWQQLSNFTFDLPPNRNSSHLTSYAFLRSRTVQAGAPVFLEVRMLDEYENRVSQTQVGVQQQYAVNVIPDNTQCNASTTLLTFSAQQQNALVFTSAGIPRACLYKVQITQFTQNDGMQEVKCLNCYLKITPTTEDVRRFEFVDARDVVVSNLNTHTIYLNRFDWNPKLIMIMHDTQGNLITARSIAELQFTYVFEILARGGSTVLKTGTWEQLRSFHLIQFCSEASLRTFCFQNDGALLQLRIRQLEKGTSREIARTQINLQLADNLGAFYNADSFNPLSANYTFMQILNQDSLENVGQDLPVIQEKCVGGDEYPVIGRLDFRTVQGFRFNQTYAQLQPRISIKLVNVSETRYSVQLYPGNTMGQVIFVIFVKDNYYLDRESAFASLFIDGQEWPNKQIVIQCDRKLGYNNQILNSTGVPLTQLNLRLVAGENLVLNLTQLPDFTITQAMVEDLKQIPYESGLIYINMTSNQMLEAMRPQGVVNSYETGIQAVNFGPINMAGSGSIVGAGIPNNFLYNITVVPGLPTGSMSQVTLDTIRVVAGTNVSLQVMLDDRLGNQVNLTNSTADLQVFQSISQVFYAKVALIPGSQNQMVQDNWQLVPREACWYTVQGRVRCTIRGVTEKGLYRIRVVINGEITQCLNCYFRVVPTQRVMLSNTVLGDLSQNFYANQQFCMGPFNQILRHSNLYFKFYLKDDFENVYIHEDLSKVEDIWPRLSNSTLDYNLSASRIAPSKALNSLVYKVTLVQTSTSLTTWGFTREGQYSLRLVTNTLGVISYPVYVKETRTSPGYVAPRTATSVVKTRDKIRQQIAGKFVGIQFGMFTNDFLVRTATETVQVQFSNPLPAGRGVLSLGDQIVSQYKGIFERYQRLTSVTFSQSLAIYQETFTVTINGFDSAVQGQFFQTTVFPGPLSKISYSNDSTRFRAQDAFGNDVDHTQEPDFNLQVIQLRPGTNIYNQANDFTLAMNYTEKRGVIVMPTNLVGNLFLYSIFDSNLTLTQNAFMNYTRRGQLDLEKSSFSYSPYTMIAGRNLVLRVSLVDSMGQPANDVYSNLTLGNLTIHLVHTNVRNPADYGKRLERVLNFSDATVSSNGEIVRPIQVNTSGYYYFEVRYRGVRLVNPNNTQWLWVDFDPLTGITRDLQWSISMTVLQKNRVFAPLETPQGLDYATFMKSQPVYFIAKLCDKFGNPFYSPSYYDLYNVGDTALSSRIKNYGDTRSLSLNTQFVWNFMTIAAFEPLNRGLIKNFVPSYYPLVNDANYDNLKSYKIDVYSPSNTTTQNVNLKVLFLVVTSDSVLDKFHSANVTNSQDIDLRRGGLVSDQLEGGMQIRMRRQVKNMLIVQLRNDNNRPYLAEPIINFTLAVTNVTLQNQTIGGKIVTIFKPLDTLNITIIPYLNDAFYRVIANSSTLYQDPAPLNVRATVRTMFKYNLTPQSTDLTLWVFPQTPPNFLNTIVNTTYLARNQTKFQPATKITFQLVLKFNGQDYMNDVQSARRIKVFRKSNIEYVTAQLINRTHYNISVNLEGPQTNQFRIYYQDTNKALYPLITPDVLNFEINTGSPLLQQNLDSQFESFYYEKLGMQTWMKELPMKLQAYDPTKVRLVLIPNMFSDKQASPLLPPLTYYIGNEFRTSIILVDNQTSRCLLQSDYNPQTDITVQIQRFDPVTKQLSRISLDVESISLVQKTIIQSTSYCTFYSIAMLESSDQLNTEGNYTLTATFLNTISTNLTFQARISGIDFTKTTIGWYQQQTLSSFSQDKLIAEFNAYDEFNYVIYFKDVQGRFMGDRQQYVKIQVKFDQQRLLEEKDYKYISRYDDRFKGYLVTITFLKAGSFQPEYYFNLQRADNIQVSNGPVLFVVREPQCVKIQILSVQGAVNTNNAGVNTGAVMMGQLFTVVFHCFDIYGKEINHNIDGLKAQAVFTNLNMNDQLTFVDIEPLNNGIYRMAHKFYLEGTYIMKIYFNNLLIYQDIRSQYQVISELCKDRSAGGSGQLLFRCPNAPQICANSYQECQYINLTRCANVLSPFLCGIGGSASDRCVSNMQTECCKINDRSLPDYKWCPHQNLCMNVTINKCPSMMPSPAPMWCESLRKFVSNRTECCGDIKYNVTRIGANETTIITKSMVKCSQEDKCVPEDTAEFCFYSFERNCAQIFGADYSYQCTNDGKCRRGPLECPSPRVCPSGYTQCPDYTCIRGMDKFNQCNKLQNCMRTLADGSIIEYIRCPDGTCSRTYEDCPSQISCMVQGQVVCPDGSCKGSELECIQPNECNSDKPFKCAGFPSVCARTRVECPQPSFKSCGGSLSLCANGDCSTNCKKSSDYLSSDIAPTRQSCASQGLVQCPNLECRSNYIDCSDTLYCPVPLNYTYSPSAIICPGAQICALNRQDCSYSRCENALNQVTLPSNLSYDRITKRQVSLLSCYDGRCHLEGRQKQEVCMTPISCSNSFFKSGGFGEFCVSNTNLSQSMMEISILLNDNQCPSNKVKCVTGECRSSLDDCPSQVTCPADLPIKCRDGQCVRSKIMCSKVDQAIQQNLVRCQQLGLMLCTSDLVTCTTSLSMCPSRSSCPIGHIKCWDESCVNPIFSENCPSPVATKQSQRMIFSTCPDPDAYPYHCFSDGSCRSSLEDCPSISYCPQDRPVKCAADNSCRKSISNCPQIIKCPQNYKFCPGEGTCISSLKQCGSPVTCPQNKPYMCEDGACVADVTTCWQSKHALTSPQQTCVEDETNYLCMNDRSKCTQSLQDCPSTSSCTSSHMVKSMDKTVCLKQRETIAEEESYIEQNTLTPNQCYLNNQYRCPYSGLCSDFPCQEWSQCKESSEIKCWDGTCVSDSIFCRNNFTGCPVYSPFRCNFTGNCVSNLTECEKDATISLRGTALCQKKFNLSVSCPFDGSCAASTTQCPTQPNSWRSIYPNTEQQSLGQSLIPQCPEQVPIKCANGLCVSKQEDCPLSPFTLEEIQYCSEVSQKAGLEIRVPCGNGECMESSNQCLPLYECSMNLNSFAFIRCPDGSCRFSQSQCPQHISNQTATVCPAHIPFQCLNGMCAKTLGDCLRNDNGCPSSSPFKCPQTGQCVGTFSDCQNPMIQSQMMFIFPNYIPPMSATPLVAIYGKTRSICQNRGQFTCRTNSVDMPFCVDRLNDCLSNDNNCPVNQPIRCGSQCVTSYLDCKKDNCTTSQRCPSQQLTSSQCAKSDFSNCMNADGCSIVDQNFKCAPQVVGRRTSCSALPFTTYSQLASQTCKTLDRQLSLSPLSINECVDQDTPYSCADGSCVQDPSKCPTCIFFCPSLRRCVRSQAECQTLAAQNGIDAQMNCPLSAPYRCIANGKCVSEESECSSESMVSVRMNFNQTFIGALVSDKCPFSFPIKCQDGRCVSQYDDCLMYQRRKLNLTGYTAGSINALFNPLKWGQNPSFVQSKSQMSSHAIDTPSSACQVLCFDGSCRDRVENCPIVSGCSDPSRPYRCKTGFCGRDKNHCQELSGDLESLDPLSSCSYLSTASITYSRCEDGICRPLIGGINSTCLPYSGCPISKPFHCPSGECAASIDGCAGMSQCPVQKPFRCKNFKCVEDLTQCDRPYTTYRALSLEATFNPLVETSVDFAFDQHGFSLGRLTIPSNSLLPRDTLTLMTTTTQTLRRLQIYPVPDSILDSVTNEIPASRLAYLSRVYAVSPEGSLARGISMLSPAVQLEMLSETASGLLTASKRGLLTIESREDAVSSKMRPMRIEFKFDNESFPVVLNRREDICLARVYQVDTLINSIASQGSNNATWKCEQREYEMTEKGFMRFKITKLGIYAVIINPDPDVGNETTMECGFLCQNHLTILILLAALIVLITIAIYVLCVCCKAKALETNRALADQKKLAMLAASSDSFFGFGYQDHRRGASMPPYISHDAFQAGGGDGPDLDLDRVKEVLDNVDPQEPPLMPGQVVMYLASQNDIQQKQIEELKYQLQEQNEREKENLKLIKRIFHQKQLIYEQMQVTEEIKSQSRKSRSIKNKKRKEAINDPSVKKEYEDIEAYLSKILSETHLQDPFDPKASAATFHQYPQRPNALTNLQGNQTEYSFQSIPVDPPGGGGGRNSLAVPLGAESMQNLLHHHKQSHSTTDLELNQAKLKRKAADLLLKNLDGEREFEECKYEEHAEELIQLRKSQQRAAEDAEHGIREEIKEDLSAIAPQLNSKYSRRDTTAQQILQDDAPYRGQEIIDDVSGTGIDSNTLTQTLNQLFSKARKPDGGARGYSMLMSSGAVSGTVSGNLVKALNKRVESSRISQSSPSQPIPQVDRSGVRNPTYDEEDSEDDMFDQMLPYEDYQESKPLNKSNSGSKKSPGYKK